MSEHTKGDWEISWGDEVKIIDENGIDICTVSSASNRRGQHTANANLICAASIMLSALKQILPSVEEREYRLGFELPEGNAARKAISKAMGQ